VTLSIAHLFTFIQTILARKCSSHSLIIMNSQISKGDTLALGVTLGRAVRLSPVAGNIEWAVYGRVKEGGRK